MVLFPLVIYSLASEEKQLDQSPANLLPPLIALEDLPLMRSGLTLVGWSLYPNLVYSYRKCVASSGGCLWRSNAGDLTEQEPVLCLWYEFHLFQYYLTRTPLSWMNDVLTLVARCDSTLTRLCNMATNSEQCEWFKGGRDHSAGVYDALRQQMPILFPTAIAPPRFVGDR